MLAGSSWGSTAVHGVANGIWSGSWMPPNARSTRPGMSSSVMTVIFRSPSIKETPYGGQISTSIFIDDSMVAVALAQNAGDSVWGPTAGHDQVAVFPCAGALSLVGTRLVN